MKQLLSAFVLFFSLSIFFTGCKSSDAAGKTLRFNLHQGKVYEYRMDMTSEQGSGETSRMHFQYTMEVAQDSANIKTIRTTYDRILMKMNAPGGAVEIDTNEPQPVDSAGDRPDPALMMSKTFYAMKGKSFFLKVDAGGNVIEVNGLDAMAEGMINSLEIPEDEKPAVRQALTAQFNDATMKQNFQQAFNIFPDKPVGPGDSWEKTVEQPAMNLTMKSTYTVKSMEDGKTMLDLKSKITGAATGEQTGTLAVDTETGLVLDAVITQQFGEAGGFTNKIKINGREK